MKYFRFILLVLIILLAVSPVHAKKKKKGSPPDLRVEFTPSIKKARYKSRPKSEVTTKPGEDLMMNGFVKIGIVEAEMLTRKCIFQKSKEECEDIPLRKDITVELLKESAKKGGDVVVLLKDKEEKKSFDEGKVCKSWTRDYGSRYVRNYATGAMELQYGMNQERCAVYESYVKSYDKIVSLGLVLRHDPELALKLQKGDEFVYAAGAGNMEKVRSLLDEGLKINKTTDTNGQLALSVAARAGQVEMVRYLLSQGAKVNASDRITSPFYEAVDGGNLEIVRLFISKGAKVNGKLPQSDQTPLFAAARNGSVDILTELLNNKAKVNVADETGLTPLMVAAYEGNIRVLKILLENKATMNRQTGILSERVAKWTALHYAALEGRADAILVLLENGANPNIKDHFGNKPLNLARTMAKLTLMSDEVNPEKRDRSMMMLYGFGEGFYSYVNRSGTLAFAPQFTYAGSFSNGLAPVTWGSRVARRFGYIDKSGKFLVEPQFTYAEPFSEGFAVVGKGGYAYELFGEITWTGMDYGFVNTKGKAIAGSGYSKARRFSDGLAPVKGGGWGFIDGSGKMVIKGPFEDAWFFTEGLASVKVDGKYGYIDKSGAFIIKPAFGEAGPFSGGLAWFKKDDSYGAKHGFINRKGEVVIKPKFDYPAFFEGEKALVYGGVLGFPFYIDKTGEKVGKWSKEEKAGGVKAPYGGEIVSGFSEDMAPVKYVGQSYLEYMKSQSE